MINVAIYPTLKLCMCHVVYIIRESTLHRDFDLLFVSCLEERCAAKNRLQDICIVSAGESSQDILLKWLLTLRMHWMYRRSSSSNSFLWSLILTSRIQGLVCAHPRFHVLLCAKVIT